MEQQHTHLVHTWNYGYVALSYVIAALVSFVSLQLASRAEGNREVGSGQFWVVAQALVLGYGIWAMHFVGMLAFGVKTSPDAEASLISTFQVPMTILSGLAAVVLLYPALNILNNGALTLPRLTLAGTIAGMGIVLMHYLGMAAYRIPGTAVHVNWLPFLASVAIAVGASMVALYLFKMLGSDWAAQQSKALLTSLKLVAAMVMGVAITGMHYTGMAALSYTMESAQARSSVTSGADHALLGILIGVVSFMILGLAVTSLAMSTTATTDDLPSALPEATD